MTTIHVTTPIVMVSHVRVDPTWSNQQVVSYLSDNHAANTLSVIQVLRGETSTIFTRTDPTGWVIRPTVHEPRRPMLSACDSDRVHLPGCES